MGETVINGGIMRKMSEKCTKTVKYIKKFMYYLRSLWYN